MSAINPAAPILRRASRLLHERSKEIEREFSVGGAGRIWPEGTESERARRDEMRSLALLLKQLSAAFGRSALNRQDQANPVLERIAA